MSDLQARIAADITRHGPMTIAAYMGACLFDPRDGYYATRDPLGVDGDFITAPEISQIFGECIGLWIIQTWMDMGAPKRLHLIELGPGRGTLMSDILRVARLKPDFLSALRVTLVEASPALEGKQADVLSHAPVPITWAKSLSEAPKGPRIIIGNEFLDCLPIRQVIKSGRTWHERRVDLISKGSPDLHFIHDPAPIANIESTFLPDALRDAPDGAIFEFAPALFQLVDELSTADDPFAALFIDYGPDQLQFADTLQALQKHQKESPLENPGDADLTAHVDFTALVRAAGKASLHVCGPAAQGAFLTQLGFEIRAAALSKAAPDQSGKIARQMHRLLDPSQMGELFKAACVHNLTGKVPMGFETTP